ncbi:MAG: helix-turn-helix transcriptional regulator [Ktedonobacteraceae bacterium]|nr:helix-turn-helix transcriptional regulator [Ktedonobacteraceae bacterium]
MAKEPRYPNQLRNLIVTSGYTFKEISEETGISLSALFIYARGERAIPHSSRLAIARVIGCSVDELVPRMQETRSTGRNEINSESLSEHEDAITARWERYYTSGAVSASIGLPVWLRDIAAFVHFTDNKQLITRVHILLTMGYQLQSCVQRDLMDYRQAHLSYQKAFDIAKELDNTEFVVAALAREGVTLIQQDKPLEAIFYLKGGLNILGDSPLPVLCGHIWQAVSEAHAKANQAKECWEAIERAECFHSDHVQVQAQCFIRGVTAASIMAQKGVNAVLLQDYAQAINYFGESLKIYDPSLLRGKARLLAQKAEAYFGHGTLDACISYAEDALFLARTAGSSRTIARVQALHTRLTQSCWRKEQGVTRLGKTLKERL